MEEKNFDAQKKALSYASPCAYSMPKTSVEEKWSTTPCIKKNSFFHTAGHAYFSDTKGHTSPPCYVACQWPQLPLFLQNLSWFALPTILEPTLEATLFYSFTNKTD